MGKKQDHKKWRKEFNESCRERDGNKCVFCEETRYLEVHHITNRKFMPNGGYATSNGITVCSLHHLFCEQEMEDTYLSENLYKKINSSYEQAYNDSSNLK